MVEISKFIERLKRININVELIGNYPWIYLDKVNGKKVTNKYQGDHGFTIAFLPVRVDQKLRFTDLKIIFKEIRNHIK